MDRKWGFRGMNINFFPFIAALAVLGFAPALAQDVFIKPDKAQSSDDSAPSLFVKPKAKTSSNAKGPGSVKYSSTAETRGLKSKAAVRSQALEEIRELGLEPKTAEDIKMFASAYRSVSQEYMYQRRESLTAHLQKENNKLQNRLASMDAPEYDLTRAKAQAEAQAFAETEKVYKEHDLEVPDSLKPAKTTAKRRTQPRVRNAVVKKDPLDSAKPTKVFTNYR